ncbi:cyclic 2,3-diphosphoglycerate synthase [Lyngbya confervoides]|uniref:Cyclic 2,3-diphosphoglycerate synthase n=1 Tax=Lyngbya confervoides BDU141951 TaxID=1574623 RepID=A0ABD4T4R4_9CYAN|nr:cyclic 2,3-diphosphoglycerate synthase [Lyngbya confervoides]MCM1983512.1 cyclic 2,3-diphosphoglycerate synthase [Lyngbya confervoides BDU141951]
MDNSLSRTRVVIMGAAGRDFHNFNWVYRNNPAYEVIAFTAAQISGIADRRYPTDLAGKYYPNGIPIVAEEQLDHLCQTQQVDQVVFAYSDVPHAQVMHLASRSLAAGASFILLGPEQTMIQAQIPVVAVSAVRTGCGKSQTTRWLSKLLRQRGMRVAVIRHPMPYGDLSKQAVQRFATRADLDAAACTIEEREEYEPHLNAGNVVYAGVDYERIVAQSQQEAEILLWDGGNNDFPFIRPDLHIVLVDPLRAGDETRHHPGEVVLRMADIVVVAKVDAASAAAIQQVEATARQINPKAVIARASSPISLENLEGLIHQPDLDGRSVLVIEDGPTTTHGGMAYGAGYVAAIQAHATYLVDPRPYAPPDIAAVFQAYPHIGPLLPAMGYSPQQLEALRQTINATPADVVVAATPIDLAALIQVNKPVVRARYEFAEAGELTLTRCLEDFLTQISVRANVTC